MSHQHQTITPYLCRPVSGSRTRLTLLCFFSYSSLVIGAMRREDLLSSEGIGPGIGAAKKLLGKLWVKVYQSFQEFSKENEIHFHAWNIEQIVSRISFTVVTVLWDLKSTIW